MYAKQLDQLNKLPEQLISQLNQHLHGLRIDSFAIADNEIDLIGKRV